MRTKRDPMIDRYETVEPRTNRSSTAQPLRRFVTFESCQTSPKIPLCSREKPNAFWAVRNAGMVGAALAHRYGFRIPALLGSLLGGTALAVSAFSTGVPALCFFFGIVAGGTRTSSLFALHVGSISNGFEAFSCRSGIGSLGSLHDALRLFLFREGPSSCHRDRVQRNGDFHLRLPTLSQISHPEIFLERRSTRSSRSDLFVLHPPIEN